jgi:hypothetical protein
MKSSGVLISARILLDAHFKAIENVDILGLQTVPAAISEAA